MSEVSILYSYLCVSAILFSLGLFALLSRQNAIGILLGLELMLNAAGLNFAAIARWQGKLDGQVFAFFLIFLAAAEAAVGLAIIVNLHRQQNNVDTDEPTLLGDG